VIKNPLQMIGNFEVGHGNRRSEFFATVQRMSAIVILRSRSFKTAEFRLETTVEM